MFSVKISQLPPETTLRGTDLIPSVDVTDTSLAPTGRNYRYSRWQDLNFFLHSMGVIVYPACYVATTTNLLSTYDNGTAGVGATIVGQNIGVLFVDGLNPAVGSLILVKNQTDPIQNGMYVVTETGSDIVAFVLTRVDYYDTAPEVKYGDAVFVLYGTINNNKAFSQDTPGAITVGVSPILFTQMEFVVDIIGTPDRITVFFTSGQAQVDIASTYVGQNSITTLGTITTGTWHATPVQLLYGGTNAALVASNGGIFYSTATAGAILSGTPNAGWLLLSGNSSAPSWSAPKELSRTDDVNVTIGLSGSPATALVNPVTLTMGWQGVLSLARGGTNAALTASNGGIFYSTATAGAILSGTATANQIVMSGSNSAPSWSTAVYPATTTANQLLYSSSNNVITGLASSPNDVLITNGSGVPSYSDTLPQAVQLNITSTGIVTTGTWRGTPVELLYGGTNAALVASSGGIFYSTATAGAILAGTGTAGQLLISGSFSAPSWSAPQALTRVDDTNVTITLSGFPSTALVNPVTLTMGWTGVLSLVRGGTNAALTASNGGIFYSTATAGAILSGTATARQIILSGSNVAPSWSTATYPATTTVNEILYSSSNNTIVGLTTAINSALITSGTGVPSLSQTLPQAVQLNITSTGIVTTGTWRATPVELLYGGTNAALVASNGGIFYSTASAGAILAGTATARQILMSGASSAPAWSTAVYPATTAINEILYSSSNNVIVGLPTENNSVVITGPSGIPDLSDTLPQAVQLNITSVGIVTTGTWRATPVELLYGGTNAALVASNGGIFYSTATAGAILAGTITARQILMSGSLTAPAWSTATYPATTTANELLYSSSNNTIVGLPTANNNVLITSGTGVPSLSNTLPQVVQLNITSTGIVTTGTWRATPVELLYGGTNAALIASNGGIFYSTATAGAILSGTATANQIILSGANSAPSWSTATYPSTTTANQLLYSSSNNVITGLATANDSALITSAGGVPSLSQTLPQAVQLNITSTGIVTTGTWRGTPVELLYGGTNAALTASNGGIFYSTATAGAILAGTPNAGYLLVSGNLSAPNWQAPQPLTRVDDTNVTITLGGFPSISVINAVSLTMGWTGVLSLGRGGTNAALTASGGGIFYSTATSGAILSGTPTPNQIILSGSSSAPSWSTATYPATTTANQILYSSSNNVITGLATANNSVLITSAGGVPSLSTTLPQAVQLNITSTGIVTAGTWRGTPVELLYGGTNAALVASAGGIFYSTASAGAILAGTANTGYLLLSGNLSAPTWSAPAALTKTDDTNVTVTLGGSATTALVNAASITMGWTGTLGVARGGTNIGSYTLGDMLYASGTTTLAKLAGTTSTTKHFLSQTGTGSASAAPIWDIVTVTDLTGVALTAANDTNVTLTLGGTPSTALLRATSITAGWTGTLAAARLNANVVQSVTNDTNVTGSISAQNLTLGWTGTLAAGRLNSNVVQSVTNDTNIHGSISGQNLTLSWSGTLSVARGGTGISSVFPNGSVVYSNGSSLAQDVNNFYWDDSSKRLGIRATTPSATLHVNGETILNGTVYIGNVPTLTVTDSGSTTPTDLGTTAPTGTSTSPRAWFRVITGGGTTVWIPAF